MAHLRFPLLMTVVAALGGCGFFGGEEAPQSGTTEALKLPPELELERGEAALSIPGESDDTATATGSSQLLPEPENIKVRRAGADRWLQVGASPSEVWGWLPGFLERKGIEMERKLPQAGIVETAWVYTRKPLTRGPFAPRVDSRDDATAADRYLMRVEPGPRSGTSEVFVAHRRASRQGPDSWRLLPRDPFLEAEVLRSLALFMGAEIQGSFKQVANAEAAGTGAELRRSDSGELRVIVPNEFFEAWRRLGLAVDRAGFTVIERNRDERYIDVRFDTRQARAGEEDEGGFFDSLAFWRSDDGPDTVRRLRLTLRQAEDGRATAVMLRGLEDATLSPERREEILGVLAEEIR